MIDRRKAERRRATRNDRIAVYISALVLLAFLVLMSFAIGKDTNPPTIKQQWDKHYPANSERGNYR